MDATTCFRILHSVWIATFAGGRRFGDFFGSVGSDLKKSPNLLPLPYPSSNKIAYPLPWNFFCLTVAVNMPPAVDLSVFIGVGGWIKPSSWSVILRGTDV